MRVRQLEAYIAEAEAFAKLWLHYRNLIEIARETQSVEASHEEEFATVSQELLGHYRSCRRLMSKARLKGHNVIGRSIQSSSLESIAQMPDALFARVEREWQEGHKMLKELVDFLQVYQLALQEMPRWQYGIQAVVDSTVARAALALMILWILGAGFWTFYGSELLGVKESRPVSLAITQIVGEALAKPAGADTWWRLEEGATGRKGDTVRCPPATYVDLKTSEAAALRLMPSSELVVERLRRGRYDASRTLVFRLTRGHLFVAAETASAGRSLRINTQGGVVRIDSQAASLSLMHRPKVNTLTEMYSGRVELSDVSQRKLTLQAGQRATIEQQQLSQTASSLEQDEADRGRSIVAAMQGDTAQQLKLMLAVARDTEARGRAFEAFATYGHIVEHDPSHLAAHIAYQDLGIELGRRYQLIAQYRRWAEKSPSHAALQCACARIVPDPAERKARYQQALAQDGDLYWAHLGMADVLVHERRYEDAVSACQRAIAIDPETLAAHAKLVHVYCAMGRRDDARAEVRGLAEACPTQASAWRALATLYRRLDLPLKARAALLDALKLDPVHFRAICQMGIGAPSAPDLTYLETAVTWSDHALALVPDSFTVRARLGGRDSPLWSAGRGDKAFDEAKRLVEQHSESYRAPEAAAALYYGTRFGTWDVEVGQSLDAAAKCEKALLRAKSLAPEALSVRCRLATLYGALRQYDRAMAELEEAAQQSPWSGLPWAARGDIHWAKGGHYYAEEAREAYAKALDRDPFCWPAGLGLVVLDWHRGAPALIKKRLDQWLGADPHSPPALSAAYRFYRDVAGDARRSDRLLNCWEKLDPRAAGRARLQAYVDKGQWQAAISFSEKFLPRYPTSPAWRFLAIARRKAGDAEGAAKALGTFKTVIAHRPSAMIALAREYEAQDRREDAATAYTKAIAATPYRADAYRGLAELHKRSARPDEARRTLEACIKALDDPQDKLLVASLCEAQGQHAEAARWAEKAAKAGLLSANTWLAEFYLRRGKAENDAGYRNAAIQTFEGLLELRPGSSALWREYGDFLLAHYGDSRAAGQAYGKAVELDAENGLAWYGLSRARSHNYTEAYQASRKAKELNPYGKWEQFKQDCILRGSQPGTCEPPSKTGVGWPH